MKIIINNHPGGIIQQTDEPIVNVFEKNDSTVEVEPVNPVVDAIKEQTELLKKIAEQPRTQINNTIELVGKKETNIDTNYGPNIEHNGGTLSLPESGE